jgi:hypothetical protein
MAIQGIDHVVVIGEDLDRLVEQYRALGFTVTPGGRHEETGDEAALSPFQDGSYIELLAHQEPRRDTRLARLLAGGGGLADFKLLSDAIEFDLAAARRNRLPYGTAVPGKRVRPDGVEVSWLAGPVTDVGFGLPDLIQDVTPHDARVPGGAARIHANGASGIARLIVAVTSIDNAALLYQGLLSEDAETARVTDEFIEAVFRAGRQRIVLRQPLIAGPLRRHILQFGDGPFALELSAPAAREFDAQATGTHITIIADQPED